MAKLQVIKVNAIGEDANGIDYTAEASPGAIKAGYVISVPVILQYPDGRKEIGKEVRLTPKGIEQIRRDNAAETKTR